MVTTNRRQEMSLEIDKSIELTSASEESDDSTDTHERIVNRYKDEMRKRKNASLTSKMSRYIVDRLQSIYLPRRFSSYVPVATSERGFVHPTGRTPLIQGLDKVIGGSHSAADAIILCGIKPVRYLWYMMSGMICDTIQLGIDFVYYKAFHITNSSACWALSLGTSIIFRHTSHRYLVFGPYVGGYWNSLLRMYAGYSVIIVLSTLFNMSMTKYMNFSHYVAWICTLLWTGVANYFILKHTWSFGGKASAASNAIAPEDGMVKIGKGIV